MKVKHGFVWSLAVSVLIVGFVSFTGCANDETNDSGSDGDVESNEEAVACFDDLSVGEKIEFVTGLDDGSEGIAFDGKGMLLVSNGNRIIKVNPDGTYEKFADVPYSVGLAFDGKGNVLVASFGEKFDDTIDGALFMFDSTGHELFKIENRIANPNFITRTPWGTWLISDDIGANIWQLSDDENLSVWSTMVESPNGMVFSPDGGRLFVCSTFDDEAPVYRLDIKENIPTRVEMIANTIQKGLNDGIAMDEHENLYVAVNGKGKIVKITPAGEVSVVAEGLLTPASIAFGRGDGFDPCSIYVTELLGDTVWRISVGARGADLFE